MAASQFSARVKRHDPHDLADRTKAGIHTGECEYRGQDLSGMAVHVAARVMAVAEAQMIVTSQAVRDLVVGSGIEVRLLGPVMTLWVLVQQRDVRQLARLF